MNKYVYKLGEFSGSDYLEFRKGNSGSGRKFLRQDSLYVLTTRFTFSWKAHFKMMQLNIPETVLPEFVSDAKETISAIDRWVTEEIGENKEFIVIGV